MAETSCFAASFSPPPCVFKQAYEGNPMKSLTESISFGRYASESLAWEKFSAFTSNRCLEEVQQLSKAVSVSERAAYFEAHFKRRAAMKAAGIDEEQETNVVDSLQNLNFPDAISEPTSESTTNTEEHASIHISDHKECDIDKRITCLKGLETTEADDSLIFDEAFDAILEVTPNEGNICKVLDNKENLVSSEQRGRDLNEVLVPPCSKSKIRNKWDKNNKLKNLSTLSSLASVDSRDYTNRSLNLPKISAKKSFSPSSRYETTASYANKSLNRSNKLACKSMHMSMRFSSLANKPPQTLHTSSIQLPIKSKPLSTHTPSSKSSITPAKKSSTPSVSNCKSKPVSSTVSTPFKFKSEERAVLRKERMDKKLAADNNSSKVEKSSTSKIPKKNINPNNSTKITPAKPSTKIQSSGKLPKS